VLFLDGVVQSVRGIANRDKLQHLGGVSDVARLRQSGAEFNLEGELSTTDGRGQVAAGPGR
jgi:hypothetical protein